jgi:dTMP kinase
LGVYGLVVTASRLITIEGLDGAGKTTLARALAQELRERSLAVELLREPGGVALAERIRALIDHPPSGEPLSPRAEALLYASARAQLTASAVRPLLAAGTWVLLDRFVDSSLAYQGAGRGLGLEAIRALNRFATDGLVPDRTLLLALPPEACRERRRARGKPSSLLEREGEEFFAAVCAAYDQLALAEPGRVRRIDAREPPEQVLHDALAALEDLLPGPCAPASDGWARARAAGERAAGQRAAGQRAAGQRAAPAHRSHAAPAAGPGAEPSAPAGSERGETRCR